MQELLLSWNLFFFLFVFLLNGDFLAPSTVLLPQRLTVVSVFIFSFFPLFKGATFCSKVLLTPSVGTHLVDATPLFTADSSNFTQVHWCHLLLAQFFLQFHTGWLIFAVVSSFLCFLCDWPWHVVLLFLQCKTLFYFLQNYRFIVALLAQFSPNKLIYWIPHWLLLLFVDFFFCLCFLIFAFFCHLPNDGKTKPGNLMFGFSRKFNHYFCLSALLDIYNFETKLLKNKQCYLLFCICFFIPENDLISLPCLEI